MTTLRILFPNPFMKIFSDQICGSLSIGILYVQKIRRTIESRLHRRYGDDNWTHGQKMIKPKNNIATCTRCGNFYELGYICRTCYNKDTNSWFSDNTLQKANNHNLQIKSSKLDPVSSQLANSSTSMEGRNK